MSDPFQDRSFNYLQGSFVSASHDGAVQYWSMDLKRERLVQSKTGTSVNGGAIDANANHLWFQCCSRCGPPG